MNLQPRQFFADVAAVGQNRGFLRQPLRIDLRALQQILQPFRQAAAETPPWRLRGSAPSRPPRRRRARCARASRRRSPRLRARGTRSTRPARPSSASSSAASAPAGGSALGRFAEHARERASAAFRSGSRVEPVRLGRFAKRLQILFEQRVIQRRRRCREPRSAASDTRTSTWPRATRLFTSARIAFSNGSAAGGRVHLNVQPAMIQALHADHQFAVPERPAHARKSSHAAKGASRHLNIETTYGRDAGRALRHRIRTLNGFTNRSPAPGIAIRAER